jgi:hypothetical protein
MLIVPLALVLEPSAPSSVVLRHGLKALVLLFGAWCLAARGSTLRPHWVRSAAIGLILAAGGVLLVPLPSLLYEHGQVIEVAISLVAGVLGIKLVFFPYGQSELRPLGASLTWALASTAAVTAMLTGGMMLLVRVAPTVRDDAGAEWLSGGLAAETCLILIVLAVRPGQHAWFSIPKSWPACGGTWATRSRLSFADSAQPPTCQF